MNFPTKKYNIIYADPPWEYDDKANAGKRGVCHKYPTIADSDLMNLPVHQIADDDCVLFLWATWPKLIEALKLIEAWGFEYRTKAFTWIKRNTTGSLFMGMGNWTRSNDEFVLLAVKGNPKRIDAGVSSILISDRLEHSEKPHEIRNRIVKLMGDLPRIELFARTKVHGWDTWGNDEKLQLRPLEVFI